MAKEKYTPTENGVKEQADTMGILFFKDERDELLNQDDAKDKGVGVAAPIFTEYAGVSPLDALKNSVNRTVEASKLDEDKAQKEKKADEKSEEVKNEENSVKKPRKTSSLLARCMPYIYDEQGVNCAEEKPDYTLESVEDIIESAEKRANEKIARMYNLRSNEVKEIGKKKKEAKPEKATLLVSETSVKPKVKIGDQPFSAAKLFETAQIPKITETLFDDLTARRTDIIGDEKVTSSYSEQGGMDSAEEFGTKAIPNLVPDTTEQRYEDIISHTRPVNVEDISSNSVKKAPVTISDGEEAYQEVEIDDFKGKKDIKRVGSMLKGAAFIAKLRFLSTALLTALSFTFLLDGVRAEFEAATLCIFAFVLLAVAALINCNIFSAFKTAFTKNSKIELPVAITVSLCIVYFVCGIISGNFPFDAVCFPLVSLLAMNYAAFSKAKTVFANFKLVASRTKKTAVKLIGDPSVTSAMARTIISGEVLAAGQQETNEIGDFLKNTFGDKALSGKINVFTIVSSIAALFIGVAVGVSNQSLLDGLHTAVVVLGFSCAPTLFIADTMPFVSLNEKLSKSRAAVCSRYSATKIEQINALVVSAKDIFPDGSIKLYNMTPLSANELDETLVLAAAVADVIKSPLAPVFKKILSSSNDLPVADTVKYEENLGISGWVDDDHILIGNRSLMIAHGVRVPALEVDKKILRKGYFPVYVAINQRACALLVVGYTVDRGIERKLGRLLDKGITLLVENCDPNISEQMLCDYFSFYPELVKVLDHNGAAKYLKATEPKNRASAHGFHKGTTDSFLDILVGCIKIRFVFSILYAIHTITSVVCWTMFAVLALGGAGSLAGVGLCLICQLISTIIALTAHFALKI